MESSTIPKKYVKVQSTQPANAVEGDLWYNTTTDALYTYNGSSWEVMTTDLDPLRIATAQNSIDIVELQANTGVTPFTHTGIISETNSDADGFNNLIVTGGTDATFNSDKYERYDGLGASQDSRSTGGSNYASGDAGDKVYSASTFTTTSAYTLGGIKLKMKKVGSPTFNVTVKIYAGSGGAPTGSALATSTTNISSAGLTTSYVSTEFAFDLALSNATQYAFVVFCDSAGDGSNYVQVEGNGGYSGNNWNKSSNGSSWTQLGVSDGFDIDLCLAGTPTDQVVKMDVSSAQGTITSTELVLNCPNRESGDSITYDIFDTDANSDTGLAVETQNALVNVDGTKLDYILINLIKSTGTPTSGIPSVKTQVLKLWT